MAKRIKNTPPVTVSADPEGVEFVADAQVEDVIEYKGKQLRFVTRRDFTIAESLNFPYKKTIALHNDADAALEELHERSKPLWDQYIEDFKRNVDIS